MNISMAAMASQSSNVFRVVDLSLDSPVSPPRSPGGFQSGCAFLRLISSSDRFGTSLAKIRIKKCQIFTSRARSTTGDYVFTGVCLLTGGGGYPVQGTYPQSKVLTPLPPARSGWGEGYPKVPTPLARSGRRGGTPRYITPPPHRGQGLATRRVVCLLRSRRIFLFRV